MLFNILFFGKKVVYNIGGKSKVSILELANMIGNELGKETTIPKIENELNGNPKIVNISVDEYINEFNKNEFISLQEGIKTTIEWQKKLYLTNENNT